MDPRRLNTIRLLATLAALASLPAAADWATCAQEGGACRFNGRHEVAFGVGKTWNTRVYSDGVPCTTEKFGDPAPGQRKSCRIKVAAEASAPQAWTTCAREDGFCDFEGRREVAYGAGDKWVSKVFTNGVKCSYKVFGDPAPGVHKTCRVRAPAGQVSDSRLDATWRPCAREGQACRFEGVHRVSYGANGRVLYRTARGGIACTVEAFGGDPAPGIVKSCHYDPK